MSDLEEVLSGLFVNERAVEALFFNGSRAIGQETLHSDYDFTCLVRRRRDETAVLKQLESTFEALPPCHDVPQFKDYGRTISISLYCTRWIEARVASLYTSRAELLKWQGTLQHKVVEARSLIDRRDLLPRWRQSLTDYPQSLAIGVSRSAIAYLETEYLNDWSFHSIYHYGFCLGDILKHIAIALYALNRRLYMPPLKRFAHDLPTLQPDVSTELAVLTQFGEPPEWDRIRSALETIVMCCRQVSSPLPVSNLKQKLYGGRNLTDKSRTKAD